MLFFLVVSFSFISSPATLDPMPSSSSFFPPFCSFSSFRSTASIKAGRPSTAGWYGVRAAGKKRGMGVEVEEATEEAASMCPFRMRWSTMAA